MFCQHLLWVHSTWPLSICIIRPPFITLCAHAHIRLFDSYFHMPFILAYIFIFVPFLLFYNKYEMNTGKNADSLIIKEFNNQSLVPCTKIRHLTEKSQDHEICSLIPKLRVGSSLRELSNHLGKPTLHRLLCARWGTENGGNLKLKLLLLC